MPLRYGLIEPVDLGLPRLPTALEGLRIAHISDPHVRKPRPRHEKLLTQLTAMRLDLLVLTGDYMTVPGDEDVAFAFLKRLAGRVHPALGTFGVFGNHDSQELIDRCLAELPAVTWLINDARRVTHRDIPIDLLGLHTRHAGFPDAAALAQAMRGLAQDGAVLHRPDDAQRPIRLLLSHYPFTVAVASDLGADLVIAGHTHGGQLRLPGRRALVNSSPLPLPLTAGLLRHRDTLAIVSRGLGELKLPLRTFCPPHAPVYTLRKRSLPGLRTDETTGLWQW